MTTMSSCCQQTSTTPSIRESIAAKIGFLSLRKTQVDVDPKLCGKRAYRLQRTAALAAAMAGRDFGLACRGGCKDGRRLRQYALLTERRGEEFGSNPCPLPAPRRQRILVGHANGIDPAVSAGLRLVGVSYDQDGLPRHFLRTYTAESCRPTTRLIRARLKR